MYSGNKPLGLFVDKLESNLNKMNVLYAEIVELFANAGVSDFEQLPDDAAVCGQFAKLFKGLNDYLDAVKIQGFTWAELAYTFDKGKQKTQVILCFDENTGSLGFKVEHKVIKIQ